MYFYEEAIARARELDGHFTRTRKVVGPLHGVPIAIKVISRINIMSYSTLQEGRFNRVNRI